MMHQAALAQAGLFGYYLPLKLEAADLPAAVAGLAALGFQGLNVTAPHKEAIAPYLVSLSPEAKEIGAVNTLSPAPGGYSGHNTDAPGFATAYLNDPPVSKALVFGAGGAARAVIQALKSRGLAVSVVARNPQAAAKLAKEFGQSAGEIKDLPNQKPYPIVVNASSASYEKELSPLPKIPLAAEGLVVDVNYGRPDNYWSALAGAAGARFEDGLGMLAHQARLSFNLWTQADIGLSPFAGALAVYLREGLIAPAARP
jgi:shikimate dehydrogenase